MSKKVFIVLLVFLTILVFMFAQLFWMQMEWDNTLNHFQPDYHLQVISTNNDTYSYTQFVSGAQKAADELNTYVEFINIERWSGETLETAVDQGIYAKVDGIAVKINDADLAEELYQKAKDQNIQLTFYESEIHNLNELHQVGLNSFTIGMELGQLALASDANCRALLVTDKAETSGGSQNQSRKMMGILSSFDSSENAEIIDTYPVGSDLLSVENMLDYLLAPEKEFNTVICLQESITPMLAQRIIDHDLVDKIKLIGFGAPQETLDYIDRNVIYGSVCPDSYDIGYNTVKQQVACLKGEAINTYSSTSLQTITKSNVKDFISMQQSEALVQ